MENKYVGQVFGIYTIIGVRKERKNDGHLLYDCRCNVCGNTFVRRMYDIRHSKECQHIQVNWNSRRLGKIYHDMLNRCYNNSATGYRWYGEREVGVCEEWSSDPKSFETWALNSGYADDLTIDRIDADKNYCPTNCRWVPLEENARRAGQVNWITIGDTTLTGRQWAQELGLGLLTIDRYIRVYGVDKTKELISAILQSPLSTKHRKPRQSWFSVYGIAV